MGFFSVDDAWNIFRHQIVIFLIQLFEKPRAVKFCIAEGRVKKCEILPCDHISLVGAAVMHFR